MLLKLSKWNQKMTFLYKVPSSYKSHQSVKDMPKRWLTIYKDYLPPFQHIYTCLYFFFFFYFSLLLWVMPSYILWHIESELTWKLTRLNRPPADTYNSPIPLNCMLKLDDYISPKEMYLFSQSVRDRGNWKHRSTWAQKAFIKQCLIHK